ncbi:MAG: IS110 family transposase [Candidatus Sumerlaeota bacterium]|nr:IS110 family transposase [Candidatus Sumerlaeota bacterium]
MSSLQTIGVDLGDKFSRFCILSAEGNVERKGKVGMTRREMEKFFGVQGLSRVVIEAGTHSPWVSRAVSGCKHEVIVGNPRKTRLISYSDNKNDDRDAETLARLGRADPKLLSPIQHRGVEAQTDMAMLKCRDVLVESRTKLINHARGIVKSFGERFAKCSSESFARQARLDMPETLKPALDSILDTIEILTEKIRRLDRKIVSLCDKKYPETRWLRSVAGVGEITALAYVLKLEDPKRFVKSRAVGVYFGLTPRRDQSGEVDKQLHITKAGDCVPYSDIVHNALGVHDKFDLEIAAPESFGSQCAPAPRARQQRARMEATRNG